MSCSLFNIVIALGMICLILTLSFTFSSKLFSLRMTLSLQIDCLITKMEKCFCVQKELEHGTKCTEACTMFIIMKNTEICCSTCCSITNQSIQLWRFADTSTFLGAMIWATAGWRFTAQHSPALQMNKEGSFINSGMPQSGKYALSA